MAGNKFTRWAGGSIAATCVGVLMFAAPAAAQTYSDGGGNNTNQGTDTNTGNTGDNGAGAGGVGTEDDGVVTQVSDDLAFTGSDARSLALIGTGIAGAGALLIVTSKRREPEAA